MNKAININLASTFFYIDENAYHILNVYLSKLTEAFSKTLGKEEILRDIEMRMAELFQKRKKHSEYVINTIDVKSVIDILGQPEDFDLDDEEYEKNSASFISKKLFRDPEDKYIGGVASGLGYYFGTNTSLIRIIWILLGFLSIGTILIIYLLLWAFTTSAESTADKLKMKGEPVNVSTIEKKIKEQFEEVSSKFKNVDYQKASNSLKKTINFFVAVLEKILGLLPEIIFKLIGVLFIIISASSIIGIFIGLIIFLIFGTLEWPFNFYFNFLDFNLIPSISLTISLILFILIPFLFLLSVGIRLLNSKQNTFSTMSRFILFILWLISLIFLIVFGTNELRKNRFSATKTKQEQLNINPTDTVFVKSNSNIFKESGVIWEFDSSKVRFIEGPHDENWWTSNSLNINIKKSKKKFSYVDLKYKANGSTYNKAQENANSIRYQWTENNGVIDFDSTWKISTLNSFNNEELELTLYLQEGQLIYIDKNLKTFLHPQIKNDQNYYGKNIVIHYWKMGQHVLECLDCKGNKKELYLNYQDEIGKNQFHLNVDSQGIKIKIK
jgi:phage shock protein PspC (stress-responsive transcriptional regulator)